MNFIDTHTHLDFPEFDADRGALLADCRRLGIGRMLVLGVEQSQWARLWQLVCHEPGLYAAFGLHPVFLERHRPEHLPALREQLQQLADDPRCCAVGEIGLDHFVQGLDRDRQLQLFEAQLQLASQFNLPVLLHVRRAHAATIAALKRARLPRAGIVHAFAGSLEEAREYLRLGFKLGLGGAVTWPQARRLQRVAAALPAEALVLETDAPDMAPVFLAGQRNSPQALPQIASMIAELRGEDAQTFTRQCLINSCEVFGWPVPPQG